MMNNVLIDAQRLIDKQKAEIAELKEVLSDTQLNNDVLRKSYHEQAAHIERLRDGVIGKLDRMTDIAPECRDLRRPAERIIADFLEVIMPIIDSTPLNH